MKRKIVLYTAMLFAFAMITSCNKVVVYPGIEGLQTSDIFEVKVNQSKVWTEKFVSSMDTSQLPSWFSAPYVREPQELHIAGFAGKGKMKITIQSRDRVEKVSIRPASRGIQPV